MAPSPPMPEKVKDLTLAAFVWIWNDSQGQATPRLHRDICSWLDRGSPECGRRLLLMAFRNSGKSTLVGLFSAWTLLRKPDTRILVMAADFALARKMVRNVKRIIERHPLTRHLKPDRADQWASAQFTIRRPSELRDPSMLAKGIGANVTGSRADLIICDDVEVPNTCDTPAKRLDLRERLAELDYILIPGGTQLYVGTPHSYYTIYADTARAEAGESLPFLAGFDRLERPLLDEDGKSRWPERFPDTEIDALRSRSGPAKFESQMMLRPRNLAEGRLDPDLLVPYSDDLDYTEAAGQVLLRLGDRRLASASCWWDPAFGRPDAGDASVVACVFTDEDGDYWLHRVHYLTVETGAGAEDAATQQCRAVADFLDDLYLPAVTLETNGLGRFLPGLLRKVLAEKGYTAAVVEKASTRSKEARILEALDAPLAAGRIHAHQRVLASPFVTEMREWRPGLSLRDDGLDAVSGAIGSEPVRLRRIPPARAKGSSPRQRPGSWTGAAAPNQAQSDFNLFADPKGSTP
ncbi:MAG: phage terminase large subunit [Rhodospirillales bacterium]